MVSAKGPAARLWRLRLRETVGLTLESASITWGGDVKRRKRCASRDPNASAPLSSDVHAFCLVI